MSLVEFNDVNKLCLACDGVSMLVTNDVGFNNSCLPSNCASLVAVVDI